MPSYTGVYAPVTSVSLKAQKQFPEEQPNTIQYADSISSNGGEFY